MNNHDPLSVPAPRLHLPQPLEDQQRRTAANLADALCCSTEHPVARPSECPEFQRMLDVALATRVDMFDAVIDVLNEAANVEDAWAWLRALQRERPAVFRPLSSVLAGAYLMIPEIRKQVNYPGQGRNPAPFDQAANELSDGILDPVLERGPIYRKVADLES
jgi:hypothetical protein